jgi:WD40 repeat protein
LCHWHLGNGGVIRVWDLASGKELATNDEAHQGNINVIAVTATVIATAGDDHFIRLWDWATGKQQLKLAQVHWERYIRAMALSPDGTKVASSLDGIVGLRDTATGGKTPMLPGHGFGCMGVSFTPDGRHLLACGDGLMLRKWDVATGKLVLEHALRPQGSKMPEDRSDAKQLVKGPLSLIFGTRTFSLDGKLLVLYDASQFHVFDVATGKDLYQIQSNSPQTNSVAISPDNRLLLASAFGKPSTISLWELATRQLRMEILQPDGEEGPVAFSPDNKVFATTAGQPDRRIVIWDMANGNEVGVIKGFRARVISLAFTPDGNRLIAGMDDTTALVWDWKYKG